MVVRVADVVVAQADVADLVDLVAAARVAVVDVLEDALLPALADAEDAMDVEEHALENVEEHALGHVEVDVLEDAEDAMDVQDVEAHVQAHARQVEKARLVLHAIAAPDALVRVLHVLRVADVVAAMDVVDVAAVHPIVMVALDVLEDVVDHAVVDVLEDVVDVQGAVLDAMAHVLAHVTGAVMAVVDNVKTHVLLTAQQRVQVPAKLKHLVP